MKVTLVHERGYRRECEVDEKLIESGGRIPCAYLRMMGTQFPNTWWLFDLNTGHGSEDDVRLWKVDALDLERLRDLARVAGMKIKPRVPRRYAAKSKVPKRPAPRQLSDLK